MAGPLTAAVEAVDLGKRYGDLVALQQVDLRVGHGEFVTLFGPSGCGKTTLLKLLAGLETPSSGTVRLLGAPPAEAARRKDVAWVPQSPALLPWLSVRDNALLPDRVNRRADRGGDAARTPEDVDALLVELGLAPFADALPNALSGGLKQRVALARGFVQGAPVMLMDEPFSALDELRRTALRFRLRRLAERHRRTVVFVTHSATEAVLLSDRVVVMTPRPGRVHRVLDVAFGGAPRDAALMRTAEFGSRVADVRAALAEHGDEDEHDVGDGREP